MDKKNAIRLESVLNQQSTVKVYTDGSKLNGRVGAGFYAEYPNNSPKQTFFLLEIYTTVFQAEVLAISEVAKNLLLEKMHSQSQARSQKFAMGGCFGGLGAEPPALENFAFFLQK